MRSVKPAKHASTKPMSTEPARTPTTASAAKKMAPVLTSSVMNDVKVRYSTMETASLITDSP